MEELLAHAHVGLGTLLAFMRIAAFFITAPFPPAQTTPAMARIIFAAGLAFAVARDAPVPTADTLMLGFASETILGLAAGFLLRLALTAFTVGGEIAGTQMWLATPSFIDPDLPAELTIVGAMFNLLALGVFVLGDGLVRVMVFLDRSFTLLPPGRIMSSFDGFGIVARGGEDFFALAVSAAAPLMAAVFAAQLMLGVLAKAAPQLNLFVEGPALTIGAGLIGIMASVHTFVPMVNTAVSRQIEVVTRWLFV